MQKANFCLIWVFLFCLCFSSGHVWMWELDCEESWVPKNWCFWTVVLEKTLESPLDCKEIQPVHSKGDQSWVFIGRTDAEAETPVLWPPHAKSWLIGKDSDAGRDWGQEEKGTTEDEMAGWHHQLGGHEFEWTPGVDDGQGGLACCDLWRCKESDTTELLNWTELNYTLAGILDGQRSWKCSRLVVWFTETRLQGEMVVWWVANTVGKRGGLENALLSGTPWWWKSVQEACRKWAHGFT